MNIVWTEEQWLVPGLIVLGALAVGLFFSYRRRQAMPAGLRWLAGSLKWCGLALLLAFILQPKVVRTFSRPGTNHWAILLDTSASMTLRDQEGGKSRASRLTGIMTPGPTGWQQELAKDFAVDTYTFDTRLRQPDPKAALYFDGPGSALGAALNNLRERYRGRPLAGILVITDGSPTDSANLAAASGLPPTFPLVIAPENPLLDLSVSNITAQATLFEDAPLIVDVTISARGMDGRKFIVTIREHAGKILGEKKQAVTGDDMTWVARFQVRPEAAGTVFLDADVSLENPGDLQEATLENNHRIVAANRETGPYRVLYLGGRPNYEHKFLQRALEEDPSIRLTSLIRIARREPKFDYRSRRGETSNPLYRGFGEQDDAEQYDEAVFIRLNTKDAGELAAGFPKTPAELFPFDTVILDDVEAAFFDREQQRLLQRFVSERGGSVIMLGGMESLDAGGFHATPVGEMLPVYLDPATPPDGPVPGRYDLTREGRLEPWARLRATEEEEAMRIDRMPVFSNVHRLPAIRPGTLEIGILESASGTSPALAVRRYGRGRTAILAIGDLWRWGMKSPEAHADMDKTWRQMLRWLLADVPRPLSVKAEANPGSTGGELITTELLGEDFQPRESGAIRLRVKRPDATWTQLSPRPHPSRTGTLESVHSSAEPGPYLAEATTRATDDKPSLTAQAGWVVNAIQDEYLAIRPDMQAMEALATTSGGRLLKPEGLDEFVATLKNLPLPVTETRSDPLWNTPAWLLAALACFIGEWSLRRWKKLP